jgi:hypothetical protein
MCRGRSRECSTSPTRRIQPQPDPAPVIPKMSTKTAAKFLRRDPAEVEPWAETCGQIRPLIEEKDRAAGEVLHVEIDDT